MFRSEIDTKKTLEKLLGGGTLLKKPESQTKIDMVCAPHWTSKYSERRQDSPKEDEKRKTKVKIQKCSQERMNDRLIV